MARRRSKPSKLLVNLPFGLGQLELQPDETEQHAAWALYVELMTRVALQPLDPDSGSVHEAIASLYNVFEVTREILREAGPGVAHGPTSFGPIAIEVVNVGLRPFLTRWHPLLLAYEQNCPPGVAAHDHERAWEKNQQARKELSIIQVELNTYAQALAQIAGAK